MSDLDKIDVPSHDERQRDVKLGEYLINAVIVGQVVCSRPGVTLVDMYRSMGVLAKDHKLEEPIK
jgi:hypothetical protein